jgi:aspartyl-tRNA(Asn)/glutamyl-tRNA(Gln) amidotransferase subunit A
VPVAEDVGQRFGAAVALLQPHVRTSHMAATVLENVFADFAGIVLAEAGFHHFGLNDSARIADYEPETRQRLTLAREVTLGRYAECQERRRHFMEALDHCMSDLDFLILPATACTAPLRGQASATIGEWTGNVREALMAYTAPFNLSGLPAISLPLPGDPGALPAGLQIVGRRGADSALLKFAYVVEAALRSACDDNPGPRILEEQKR